MSGPPHWCGVAHKLDGAGTAIGSSSAWSRRCCHHHPNGSSATGAHPVTRHRCPPSPVRSSTGTHGLALRRAPGACPGCPRVLWKLRCIFDTCTLGFSTPLVSVVPLPAPKRAPSLPAASTPGGSAGQDPPYLQGTSLDLPFPHAKAGARTCSNPASKPWCPCSTRSGTQEGPRSPPPFIQRWAAGFVHGIEQTGPLGWLSRPVAKGRVIAARKGEPRT